MDEGRVKTVEKGHVAIVVLSDFIAHNREHVKKGQRITVPRALAHAMIAIGNAREDTSEDQDAGEPTPPETAEVADPTPDTRDPKARKR